jgi:hypothetical protein
VPCFFKSWASAKAQATLADKTEAIVFARLAGTSGEREQARPAEAELRMKYKRRCNSRCIIYIFKPAPGEKLHVFLIAGLPRLRGAPGVAAYFQTRAGR